MGFPKVDDIVLLGVLELFKEAMEVTSSSNFYIVADYFC